MKKPLTLEEILRRPGVSFHQLSEICPEQKEGLGRFGDEVSEQVEISVKYEGYIERQKEIINKLENLDRHLIPYGVNYASLPGLSREVIEKLDRVKPVSLGQASRISGITPAAISILMIHLRKMKSSPQVSLSEER